MIDGAPFAFQAIEELGQVRSVELTESLLAEAGQQEGVQPVRVGRGG
ncbi:MAG: hypothetical protein AB7I38_19765 [Dehalococcoidia bacterium]